MSLSSLLRRSLIAWLCLLPVFAASAAEEFLPSEEAFRFEARAFDARTVEIVFTAVDGYYLYREQFRFTAAGGATTLGQPQLPPGKVKFDETFAKDVETYRGRVVIRLPVEQAPASFRLTVISQGCADAGLCYPPMESTAEVSLVGFGGDGSVRVAALANPLASVGGLTVDTTATRTLAGSGDASVDDALRSGRFWVVASVFFVAGLLLSLTPCVLPMLPILSSIIVGPGGSGASRSRGLLLALAYSLGMAMVYTAFGVAAGLAGEGLAAWLQQPWVLAVFAAMLALLALSMFGLYELQLPARWRDRVAATSGRLRGGQLAGVFAMGGVSALIVSPCVAAPLAGALVYISQTRDVLLGGGALFALAAGMSVPLLLLGASAGALLPTAGPWMEGIKRFFGVLLLGVAWWTLSPVLPATVVVAGWGLLLLLAAGFLGAFERVRRSAGAAGRLSQLAGWALAVIGAVQLFGAAAGARDPLQSFSLSAALLTGKAPSASTLAGAAGAGSPAAAGVQFRRVASVDELDAVLRSAGRPVMLDFYADWCISCKEMERFTFADPAVSARLGRALLLQADVTRNNEADRALLKRFGLFGPPGIVFFDASGRELGSVRVIGFQDAARFGQSLTAAGL
jgi:thiol:disulfide interchange protein DsbD